ncbi:hypothetical protein AYL99_10067 [Fonsecaea erecta]|uniref:Uncharacterized protein n=1 Tax=Fonsecaea erecta TaxID=1367422 RepID=A0A178ZA11_9EURO|nr:hypothetical protein AYL99_10067 [Fonsecaea erecta]OAP55915.1 hypothetical protein AYL99_10067 [Fonsecaea erecta]
MSRKQQPYWERKQQSYANIEIPNLIPCGVCNVKCFKARYSQNQLSKYQEARAKEIHGGPKATLPRCRNCTPESLAELHCVGCRTSKDLSFFSKQQRKKPDTARCYNCQQELEDRVPSLEAALEEERIRDDELRGKHSSGSAISGVAGSVLSSQVQSQGHSASASSIFMPRDRESAWGGNAASERPPSPTNSELSSSRGASSYTNSTCANSVSKNSFARAVAYNAPAKERVMYQLEREERQKREVQMANRYDDSDDADEWEILQPADASFSGGFSPELLQQITSQITANVLQQLKLANLPPPPQPPPHQPPPVGSQMDTSSSAAGSPPLDRATVYTPPTPNRYSEDAGASQTSPQFPPPSSQSSFRAPSPATDRRAASPLSQTGHQSENDANQSRPRGPKRMGTHEDATILERVWGQLFTEQGEATPRLGQFLRGIATHLIEDYEPRHSLVITPAKMQRYYEEMKLANELYPWKIIFDDRTSSISRMFREIECQHHLVQEKLNERPDTPGLTPNGFETWATLLLKAHPDQEYERLAKTALDMPISNPDEKKERFPKELSRRLFPKHGDTEVAYKLQKAMSTHCNVSFASHHSSTADSTSRTSTSTSTATVVADDSFTKTNLNLKPQTDKPDNASNHAQPSPVLSQASIERQRQPYGGGQQEGTTGENAEESTDGTLPPQPIERERKPYVAAPGGGKTYNNIDRPTVAPETRPGPPPQEPKLGRSSSVNATSRVTDRLGPPPIALHQRPPPPATEVQESSRRHRSNSIYHRDPAPSGRNRSPSITKETGASSYGRKADPDAPYMSSSYHSDHHDDTRRYREYEAGRERLSNDRYDAARMSAYDPRERERDRDGRPRMQSVSNVGLGFVDDPRSPTLRTSAGPTLYSSSLPGAAADEDYYLNRAHASGAPPSHNGHSPPSSISTGFQPPPPPPPQMMRESSNSASRDSGYPSYPTNSGYPPTSYRDLR